jgi:CobQ-like glutamine amidotransferase family enzyme
LSINKRWGKTEGDIMNEQYTDTGNIRFTRQRTKTNKTKNTTQKTKQMSNKDLAKTGG